MSDNFLYQIFCSLAETKAERARLRTLATAFLLPFQLSFPGMGQFGPPAFVLFPDLDADGDRERDQRTSSEWHNAVVSYLKFRAGTGWRLGRFRYRNSPRCLEYLAAIRLVQEIRYQPVAKPEPVLPALDYEHRPVKVSWWRRPWDHFTRCRCQVCRSLRMRGISPQSTRPSVSEEVLA